MEIEFKKLEEEFGKDLSAVSDAAAIEALRVKYLGRKAEINRLFSLVPSLSKEEKGVWGRNLNILKNKISAAIEEKLKNLGGKEEKIDLTYPAGKIEKGSRHILSVVSEEICAVFEKLGFTVEGTLRQRVYKNGRRHDVEVVSITAEEYRKTRERMLGGAAWD